MKITQLTKHHRTLLVLDGTLEGAKALNYRGDRVERVLESVNDDNIKVDIASVVEDDEVRGTPNGFSGWEPYASVPRIPFRRIVKEAKKLGYEQVLFAVPTNR